MQSKILSVWSAADNCASSQVLPPAQETGWMKRKREGCRKGVKTSLFLHGESGVCSSITSHPPVVSTRALPLSPPPTVVFCRPQMQIGGLFFPPLDRHTHAHQRPDSTSFLSPPCVCTSGFFSSLSNTKTPIVKVPYVVFALHCASTLFFW